MTLHIDGLDPAALARHVGAPRVEVHETVGSTMDEAHRLAEAGAESGTVVVAERQLAGRGRFGRKWTSDPERGLWTTMLHRRVDASALDVLSLRIGLAIAAPLDRLAEADVMLKWPNDLYVGSRKLGGILVEARWRDARLEWVAIGVGINLTAPVDLPGAAGLRAGVMKSDLLKVVVEHVADACSATGDLSLDEVRDFNARDFARGAMLVEPAAGLAKGITPNGTLVVETASGRELFRRGSLVIASEEG